MKLYRWHSEYLERYSTGDIVAMGETVEQARTLARSGFEPHYFERYAWMYDSIQDYLDGCDAENREEFEEARAKFETDIAVEPEELPGFILIPGSE